MYRIIIPVLFLGLFGLMDGGFIAKREGDCQIRYRKIGCFKDIKQRKTLRPVAKLVFTDRDSSSPVFSENKVNWEKWNSYVQELVCRCGEAAAREGFQVFGIQFYGECWGGNGFLFNVGGPSEHCIDEENEPCNMMTSKACAGEQRTLFVYNVAT